ncbi:MAG: DUF192 domain-containing protein [Desulfobacterales bacterium]
MQHPEKLEKSIYSRSLSDAPAVGRGSPENIRRHYDSHVCFSVHMRSVFRQRYRPAVLLVLFLAMILFVACTSHYLKNQNRSSPPFYDHPTGILDFLQSDGSVKTSITVEIADTTETQMKGLMGRSDLSIKKGMLFVFQQLKPRRFWMKNTPISLDIIFIGGDGCIVNIAESTTPMSEKHYRSDGPIKYVVEVRAGFAKRFKIDSSTCIRWRRS